jgi:hypothetical protein
MTSSCHERPATDQTLLVEEVPENDPEYPPKDKEPTPLPKFQLFVACCVQLAEPVTSSVIYPFINQLVRETGVTGGDERKTGYYAGLIVRYLSIFFYMFHNNIVIPGVGLLCC